MPIRAMSSGDLPISDSPSKVTVPLCGLIRPLMVRSVVDFPAPLPPSRVTTSPWLTSNDTPRRARISP
jgi:hypothetical protein